MGILLAFSLILAHATSHAADKAAATPAAESVKGEVLETLDAPGFTYMRLKTRDGEAWTAVRTAPVKIGTQVTVENGMTMKNFESKSLQRTFPSIVLGNLAGAPKAPQGSGMSSPHATGAAASAGPDIMVAKAAGANARTVAEINAKGAELKDKPVLLRAKVVKFNGGIMSRNWLHLRDGTGSAADNSNDVLATTAGEAKVGDIVLVEGVVRTEQDFGSGYAYKVMIEDAKLKK